MRIVIVLSGLGAGGAERVAAILAAAWVSRGWEVAVLCFDSADTAYHAFPPRVRIIRSPSPAGTRRSTVRASLDLLGRVLFLRRTFRLEEPDMVVSFLTKINVTTLLATLGTARPVIVCERNNPLRQEVRPVWHMLQNLLARRATLVLQTDASKQAFSAAACKRSRVIPNPVEHSTFLVEPSLPTVVAAGRLVQQKGFDLLLDAFARVSAAHPSWNLVIWGEGPLRSVLERQRDALGLRDRVSFPGITSRPREWVRSGSVFVLSSRYEGFPNVLIEAMSAGMAVAAFDCPFGPAEIVHDGRDGLLVAAEDSQMLANCLERLIGDEVLRARLGRAARFSVRKFAADRVILQWDEALTSAISNKPGRVRFNRLISCGPEVSHIGGCRLPPKRGLAEDRSK